MTTEDDRLRKQLARLFMTAKEHCDPNSDGYRDFIKRQLAANDIVYLVWADHNQPHGIDYDVLRETAYSSACP